MFQTNCDILEYVRSKLLGFYRSSVLNMKELALGNNYPNGVGSHQEHITALSDEVTGG